VIEGELFVRIHQGYHISTAVNPSSIIVEEKETNAIQGPWCPAPLPSLDTVWNSDTPIYRSFHPKSLHRHQHRDKRRNRVSANSYYHNNNNESPPDKKATTMLLQHPLLSLPSRTTHDHDSPQPLDFSVSRSKFNGHVETLRIPDTVTDISADDVSGNGHRQDGDNSSDPEYATRTTSSASSSASAISEEGSLGIRSPGSPDQNENGKWNKNLFYASRGRCTKRVAYLAEFSRMSSTQRGLTLAVNDWARLDLENRWYNRQKSLSYSVWNSGCCKFISVFMGYIAHLVNRNACLKKKKTMRWVYTKQMTIPKTAVYLRR